MPKHPYDDIKQGKAQENMRLSEWGEGGGRLLEFYHGRGGVAAGYNTRPLMNISAHFHPILPLTWAGFHQNQISTTYPLLPDSGRSDSELKFGPCTTELLLTYPLLWKTAQGSPQGQGPTLGLRPCQVNNAWQH